MKISFPTRMAGAGILAAVALGFLGWSFSATTDFTFPVSDSQGMMNYRCQTRGASLETEENARAAHAFFEPLMLERARIVGDAMAAVMLPGRPSSEVAAELEGMNAAFDARLRADHQELQQRFGCQYRGST